VAYIYGTCFALRGLAAAGEDDREAHVLRAGEWLRSIQNADGGWGESCASYDNDALSRPPRALRRRPRGRFWALIAGGDDSSRSVQHGIEYLLETQREDGNWDEELATGTGFPKVFYLNYHASGWTEYKFRSKSAWRRWTSAARRWFPFAAASR
jgi:squalene-hopene/tetraprenyl-beta-curcumene cyclase